uniref:MARTX n=1 Tax=Ganoderma boninense TaxID=34458 RepID=A0A5K1K0Z2_9APHY|nr:MARTX [Ganoderma boninense]
MSNTRFAASRHLLEDAVASLDAKVLNVLGPLGFSDSPQRWIDQLPEILADRYRSRVALVKDTIRTVAQEFRGTGRTEQLVQEGQTLVQRKDILRSMFAALDLLTSREFRRSGIEPDRLDRLQDYLPTFRAAVSAISARTSRWQDDLREWQVVFNTLEKPVSTVTLLLHFVPPIVPDAHVSEAQEVLETLAGLWAYRRVVLRDAHRLMEQEEPEDPLHLMTSLDEQHEDQLVPIDRFLAIIKELDSLPPLYLPVRDFTAGEFLEAEATFNRLCSERDSITQDIDRLECIFDHFIGIVDSDAAHALE